MRALGFEISVRSVTFTNGHSEHTPGSIFVLLFFLLCIFSGWVIFGFMALTFALNAIGTFALNFIGVFALNPFGRFILGDHNSKQCRGHFPVTRTQARGTNGDRSLNVFFVYFFVFKVGDARTVGLALSIIVCSLGDWTTLSRAL